MKWLCYIGIIFSFCCCKSFDAFYKHDHLNSVTNSTYKNDTISISNYMLCAHQRRISLMTPNFEDKTLNEDSVLNIFIKEFSALNLKIDQENGINLAQPSICHKEVIKIRHFRNFDFEKQGINSLGKMTLLPVIIIDDIYQFTGYMTSNSVAGDDGFMHNTSLKLLIFIIQNNEVIYATKHRYVSKRTMANSLEEVRAIPPAYQVREEHIEELVRRAMKRYIKRLEK